MFLTSRNDFSTSKIFFYGPKPSYISICLYPVLYKEKIDFLREKTIEMTILIDLTIKNDYFGSRNVKKIKNFKNIHFFDFLGPKTPIFGQK